MTAAPARGTRRQTDIPAASRTTFLSPNDSHLAPSFADSTDSPPSVTPQRGRSTNRYPDSLGRVPLHRRGNSKTYERLEDLLREAGYKETRVFTPESDRNARSAAEKHGGGAGNSMRGGVGAVVDFITGLVSRGSSLSCETAPLQDNSSQPASPAWSPPPSPLAYALRLKDDRAKRLSSVASLSRKGSSDSIHRPTRVDVFADASQRTHAHQVVPFHQSSQALPHQPHLKHRAQFNSRHYHQLNYSSKPSSTKPNPTNARAYLRHMASAPNIQPLAKRPSLSEVSLRSHVIGREHLNGNNKRHTFILNDEDSIAELDCGAQSRVTMVSDRDQRQVHPPLPRNWIESVAKALLSGVGGPAAVTSDTASTKTAKTASTQKSSALSDKSNREERGWEVTQRTRPPLLCVQVQDMKARTSQGQVACTSVMCRSTPTSRASSRVRTSTHNDHTNATNNGKRREGNKPGKAGKKDRDADVLPSLARTKVENDDWMTPRQRYSTGWGMQGSAQAYPDDIWSDDSDCDGDDDEEEEDGELGLDRLLVPARRQHSIQSLRKHLRRPPSRVFSGQGPSCPRSPRSGRTSPFGETHAGRRDWGDAPWGASRGREWLASQVEDEDGYRHVFSVPEGGTARSGTKWRRGLPGLAQWTTSS